MRTRGKGGRFPTRTQTEADYNCTSIIEFSLQNGVDLKALEKDYPGISDVTDIGAWVEAAPTSGGSVRFIIAVLRERIRPVIPIGMHHSISRDLSHKGQT